MRAKELRRIAHITESMSQASPVGRFLAGRLVDAAERIERLEKQVRELGKESVS